MITKQTYTPKNIRRIQEEFKVDPELAQRAVFALGLVEALRKAGLDFLFKGGSSLMLVFEVPKRLSTDVDILVPTDGGMHRLCFSLRRGSGRRGNRNIHNNGLPEHHEQKADESREKQEKPWTRRIGHQSGGA